MSLPVKTMHSKSVIHAILHTVCIIHVAYSQSTITLGGIFDSKSSEDYFLDVVGNLKYIPEVMERSLSFNATTMLMDPNPIQSALSLCNNMITERVSAVVVSHPPKYIDVSPISVSYTCGYYNIPVIGISSRDSAFSDKRVHSYFVRTVPPYSHQAYLWIELLKRFNWMNVVFIHSTDEEGWAILHRFQSSAVDSDIQIEKIIRFSIGLSNYTSLLAAVHDVQSRVYLLYSPKPEAEVIFENARTLGLLAEDHVWITTEQALSATNVPIGMIGGRLINSTNSRAHIHDSVKLLAKTFTQVSHAQDISTPPGNCKKQSSKWKTGRLVFNKLMSNSLEHGMTGHVLFDESGDRVDPVYEIINIHSEGAVVAGIFDSVKKSAPPLYVRDKYMVYMGNVKKKPKGFLVSSHLRVLTIIENPFVYAEKLNLHPFCDVEKNETVCTHENPVTGEITKYCCWGYCIDLAYMLADWGNFTFQVQLSKDGYYGGSVMNNNTGKYEWNGMVGELIRKEGDVIIGALTMTPERAQQIDFTQPYKYLALTLLMKKLPRESSLDSFLQPFQDTLWILVGLSVHLVAFVLYLLDRFSPFGRFKMTGSEEGEEDSLNLSSAMWFSWGVLLNSGIGEGTPRSFSARVLGMVWAGFAMIIIASYTANLAAFLVLDRPEAAISGINDRRLRNPTDKFKYATVKNSGADQYFKRHVDLATMARTMELKNYDSPQDAIKELQNGSLQAFIWDSPRLQYEASKHCDLVTAGDQFGRSAFSVGLQKKSYWTNIMTQAILRYHERGKMEKLDLKWIQMKSADCPDSTSAPATLGLANMAGVFMMVVGGIFAGIMLIGIEILYRRHELVEERQYKLARSAASKWRSYMEKRRTMRQTRDFIEKLKGRRAGKLAGVDCVNHATGGHAASDCSLDPNYSLKQMRRQRTDASGSPDPVRIRGEVHHPSLEP